MAARSPLLAEPGAVSGDGIDAPVAAHYGSFNTEQRLLEAGEGFVDLSHRDVLLVSGPDRLIAPGSRHQLRDTSSPIPQRSRTDPAVNAMRVRFRDPATIKAYRRRGVIVEPVNGHFKDRHGLRQYACRGLPAVQAETELVATTANLLKIWRAGQ